MKIKWIINWITSFYSSEFQKLHFNEVLHYFLENVMAMDAARAGAKIMVKTLARGMRRDGDAYIVSCQRMDEDFEIKAKIIVGADGPESRVGRWGGLKTTLKPKNMAGSS